MCLSVLFTGCVEESDEEISRLQLKNDELQLQVEALSEVIESFNRNEDSRDSEHPIESAVDNINQSNDDVLSYQFAEVSSSTSYYGYGEIDEITDVYLFPSETTHKEQVNGTVQIIAEMELDNENWLLIKCFSKDIYGYIHPDMVAMIEREQSYPKKSVEALGGIHIDDSISDVILKYGNELEIYVSPEYLYENILIYKDMQIEIMYDPVSLYIISIDTKHIGAEIGNSGLTIGDEYNVTNENYLNQYAYSINENIVVYELTDGYKLTLVLGSQNIIQQVLLE